MRTRTKQRGEVVLTFAVFSAIIGLGVLVGAVKGSPKPTVIPTYKTAGEICHCSLREDLPCGTTLSQCTDHQVRSCRDDVEVMP